MTTYKLSTQIILSAVFALMPFIASAQDYVWIIGGGPYLEHSQSQIELNVKWANRVIHKQNPNVETRIFYSDGNNPAPDVINFVEHYPAEALFLPFDYIFGGTEIHAKAFYNHSIINVAGSTKLESLKPELENDFSRLVKGDKALILYNGHGGFNGSDYSKNHLRLWGKTKLTVYDLENLFSGIHPDIPVRYIMTQCFSGAFGNAIHPEANKNTLKLEGNRCGFMAESARRESEGCSASVKTNDYRDYTTYFFAALDGKTRLNKPLASNPDRNGDNKVSLYEAHLYTLENAYSTDLSRSTSEQYLEKWEPWYLRWLSKSDNAEQSVYSDIARNITKRDKISIEVIQSTSSLREQRILLFKKYMGLKQQDNSLEKQIKEKQRLITKSLLVEYPKIKEAYKNKFDVYPKDTLTKIKMSIEQHPTFEGLPELFIKKAELILPLLEAKRKLTQVEKIARMLKLAKLDSYFKIFSDSKASENYSALLSCENTTL